jgi:hypothetical protein
MEILRYPFSLAFCSTAILLVNNNQFTGTIRDGFDQFESLDFADFKNNNFEGSLPASIFNIPTIRILYFNNNNLDGPIPLNYGSAPLLRDLFLSGNSLTGTIPEIEPGQLLTLTELLLNDNELIGTMPPSVCQLRVQGVGILEDLWSDCGPTADPRLECDLPECCTLCFPTGEDARGQVSDENPVGV